MTQIKWRRRGPCIGAVLFAIFIQVINGYEELYTISHLSPKSLLAEDLNLNSPLERTKRENIAFNIEPSVYDGPEGDITESLEKEEAEQHVIVERSADPMGDREQRSINIDEIPTSNNNEIDNELELHHKRKYYEIHPTKTIDHLQDRGDFILPSEGFGDRLDFRFPGEGQRVPKQRALPPTGPKIQPSAVQPIYATATPRDQARQHSAELQNIITEIVKRLNGNVNVQANSQLLNGRPGRPMNSRINNRGPPRIAEAPLLPDVDVNPVTPYIPTRSPPPYPFDRPPYHGVNLPEQIVPPAPYRPGFHRPNLPPWHRPRPRPTPSRRPNPNLPIYKPTTPISLPHLDLSEDDLEDILTLNDHEINTVKEHNISSSEKDNIHLAPETNVTEVHKTSEQSQSTNNTEVVSEYSEESSTKSSTTASTTSEKPARRETTEKPTTKTTATSTTSDKPKITTEKPKTTTDKPKTTTEKPKTTTEKPKEKPIKPEKEKKKDSVLEKEKPKDKYKLTDDKLNTTTNKIKNDTGDYHIEPSMSEKVQSSSVATPTERLPTVTPATEKWTDVSNTTPPTVNTKPLTTPAGPYAPYRPRPGIVLDDTDFKPHGTRQPYREASVITALDTRLPDGYGEIFDVTVSAIQGPGDKPGATVHIQNVNPATGHVDSDDIIVSPSGEQGFVSIDGKRTYLNLFGESSTVHQPINPTRVHQRPLQSPPPQIDTGVAGVAIPTDDVPQAPQRRPAPTPVHGGRPQQPYRRPQPTVRIDTCIVGDDSTCDRTQNEKCRTEAGISSCQCRPGYARRAPRSPCRRVVALVLNLRVDRLYDRKVAWDLKLADKESEPYQQLSYEALRAIDSAFSMTPFSDDFVGGSVNAIHHGDQNNQGVFVNYTILMQESPETVRSAISVDIQRHLLGVIRRRSNNVGASALWVDTPAGSVPPPTDLDECSTTDLNDCHKLATCTNTWGGFRCVCPQTTKDPNVGDISRVGRECHTCANSHCNDRGTCYYSNSQPYCSCSSGYYGSQCEVDGEVVGVAVGASLVAALVIALTLAALLSWSRKWSREQKAVGMGSPVFNYMAANTIKTPPVGQPPYQISMEERMRWAQIAEAMAANHYAADAAQTMSATRPSSALFGGYPTLPPVPMPRTTGMYSHHGTLNTVASRANTAASHHNLYAYTNHAASESTSSEASSHVQERADLLVPRPKSRARSMHNQNGIYYDVEYENTPEAIYGTKGIPLSTYTVSRGPPFYR